MSCFVFLSNFVVQYGSTVGMVLSAIIYGHRAVSAGKLTGKLALMSELCAALLQVGGDGPSANVGERR